MVLKFKINDEIYSQKEARALCTSLLNKYKESGTVNDLNDFLFLKEAFERHHYNPIKKLPSPIKNILVKPSSSGSNYQFWVILGDGTETHIGYSKKCFVTEKAKYKLIHEDNVIDAARHHIRYQQDEARNHFKNTNNLVCAICTIAINKTDLHADHTPPNSFKNIFEVWLTNKGIKITDIAYMDLNNTEQRGFIDEKLIIDWCELHKIKFNPQPTHSWCNIAQG
ncbi:hypothetical protein [Pseudoalteromonas sp. RB2-MNA-CIBAN-0110]|uniref:hypothetical protein n=1 Tax=Pseudoalteromonas sp. RB2-MNA-CIBAN-0110 TaxID=3140439 RepID=UPI003324F7DD